MIPKAPRLKQKQVEQEVIQALSQSKGLCHSVLWNKVLGIHFRNSPENDYTFRQALASLVARGIARTENGWYALTGKAAI